VQVHIPCIEHPSWGPRCAPLATFLLKGRDWPAIDRWCRENKVRYTYVCHMLSWLEHNQIIGSYCPKPPPVETMAFHHVWRVVNKKRYQKLMEMTNDY
jgi:hypothetical protein